MDSMRLLWRIGQLYDKWMERAFTQELARVVQDMGNDVRIDRSARIEYPEKLRIGDSCVVGPYVRIVGASPKTIAIDLGPLVRIRPFVSLLAYGGSVVLGRRVTVGEGSVLCGHGGLVVGENTMISWHCSIIPANHLFDRTDVPARLQGEERLGIKIGRNVWIGSGVTVLDGVTIGDDAVIGAGAVVASDIPPFAVAVGVPAQVIRDRRQPRTNSRLRTPMNIPCGESMTDVDDIVEE
jgi:acetyltransferase-like isoleucine patch superfamily enzyme